jgi:hypothetical protein
MPLNILVCSPFGTQNFVADFSECAVREFGDGTIVYPAQTMQEALEELCQRKYDVTILASCFIPTHGNCKLEDLNNPVGPAAFIAQTARDKMVPVIALVPEMDGEMGHYLAKAGADVLPLPCLTKKIFETIYKQREITTPFPAREER